MSATSEIRRFDFWLRHGYAFLTPKWPLTCDLLITNIQHRREKRRNNIYMYATRTFNTSKRFALLFWRRKTGSDGWTAASLALVSPCLKSISDWFSWWLRICGSSNVPAEGKHATTWSGRNYKMTVFSNQVSSIFLSGSLVTLVVVTVMPLSRL